MGNVSKILVLLSVVVVIEPDCQPPTQIETKMFHLDNSLKRHARLRCLQQFPQAETVNFTDSHDTQCFLHCFLYKIGLMDLKTRGLDSEKFTDIWEDIDEAFEEDSCFESFDLYEALSGRCSDTYRKLMQFRNSCSEFFEYIFTIESPSKSEDKSKPIGQSATEFCDQLERGNVAAGEISEETDASLMSLYKHRLQCIFENIRYVDAYGRVDETEVRLSFREAGEDSVASQAVVRNCAHRANSLYQTDYLGNTVLELQKCLKTLGPVFAKVFQLRDETSKQY